MAIADEDLRYGSSPGFFQHLLPETWVQIDPKFLNLQYALLSQQTLGHDAVRANGSTVHADFVHGSTLIQMEDGSVPVGLTKVICLLLNIRIGGF